MQAKPKAIIWYKVYCYLFALLNFVSAWKGLTLVRDPHGVIASSKFLQNQAIDQQTTDLVVFMVVSVGWMFVSLGVVFGLTAFSLPLAPDNRKTWVAHLVHIIFGATSCVLTPLCIPLMIAWLRPEVKTWFGVGPQPGAAEDVN